MAALAIEHETRREIAAARGRIEALRAMGDELGGGDLKRIADSLLDWLDRLEAGRRLFSPLLEADERERPEAFRAAGVIQQVIQNVRVLLPGIDVSVDIPNDLSLPPATYAEWHAVFQNVLVNAANAMLDVAKPKVLIEGGRTGRRSWLRISDTGSGVDLDTQVELFEPFKRKQSVSSERSALGLGGMGLGLTIVRMITDQRGCEVSFVPPGKGWSTTVELAWSERRE
jgi:signal transduction histidine kinase